MANLVPKTYEGQELEKFLAEINPNTGRPRRDDYRSGVKKLTVYPSGFEYERPLSAFSYYSMGAGVSSWARKSSSIQGSLKWN